MNGILLGAPAASCIVCSSRSATSKPQHFEMMALRMFGKRVHHEKLYMFLSLLLQPQHGWQLVLLIS